MLGQPLKVGDTILTKSYGSLVLNYFAEVKKVNKKSIVVELDARFYSYGEYVPRPNNHSGYWNAHPNGKWVSEKKPMKRIAMDCLKISPDQQVYSDQREQELFNLYPELFI